MIYSDSDLDVLARTIYGEARGEPDVGKGAVAHAIVNRVLARRFGASVTAVCKRPQQFSCWNDDDPNKAIIEQVSASESTIFRTCVAIARAVLKGAPDTTRGATHYCTLNTFPAWMYVDTERRVPRIPTLVVGNHKFFAGVP